MIFTDVVIDAIIYMVGKLKKADKLKIIKLLYLADKYHLAKYGRTTTGDDYYAMKNGPVGTLTKDILDMNDFFFSQEEIKKFTDSIDKIDNNNYQIKDNVKIRYDNLSKTDIEALDYVIKKFGNKKSTELVTYAHKYPEWKKYKDLFETNQTKRQNIQTIELLSKIDNDQLLQDIPEEHIEETKNFLLGYLS